MTEHIQIPAVSPRVQYLGDGTQKVFPYAFPIFVIADMEVWLGAVRQTVGYTVAGAGESEGGAVTFTSAPANGVVVTLRRRVTIARTTDFYYARAIPSASVNDDLDRLTAAIQQVAEDSSRAVARSPWSTSSADLTLPEPVAGKALRWNDAGDGLVNTDIVIDTILPAATAQANAAAGSAAAASLSQSAAAASASSAALARTAADVAAAAAAADRVQVAADKTAVHADRLAAEADAAQTAADRVQVATDTAAVHADRLAADADAAQTAADRVAVASDKTAAAASASAAASSQTAAAGSAAAAATSAAQAQAAAGVYTFTSIAVAGQAAIAADQAGDTLTLAAGQHMAITTDAATDTVTLGVAGLGSAAALNAGSGSGTLLRADGDGSQLTGTVDLGARDQIALTNLRQLLATSVASGALVGGYQWELATDEWGPSSANQTYVAAGPSYYANTGAKTVFAYTGADQTYTVPAGVTSLTVKLWGAGGGGASTNGGGAGGYTSGVLAVTPGQVLTLIVGQGGQLRSSGNAATGGGMAAVKSGSTFLAVAGGGGGGGAASAYSGVGGAGGGTAGGNGTGPQDNCGYGGGQSAGGASHNGGTAGSQGAGGAGYGASGTIYGGGGEGIWAASTYASFGGGGGYYGGGGSGNRISAADGGGGGGSGYIGGLTGATTVAGAGTTSGGSTDIDWVSGVGAGGSTSVGGPARIVIVAPPVSMTLQPPAAVSAPSAPSYADLYCLYKDDSGSAVLGTDLTVELSRDGGVSWTAAAITTVASHDGTYSVIRGRANVSGQPSGTSLKARVKTLNAKAQRIAAPALYAE